MAINPISPPAVTVFWNVFSGILNPYGAIKIHEYAICGDMNDPL
jgi:hypothetical protein